MAVRVPVLPASPLPPFTRRDLRGLGISRHELDALLAARLVAQPVRGAYLDARCRDDLVQRATAVGLVLPADAAVANRTAAWMHGIDTRGPGERAAPLPLECVVAAGRTVPKRAGLQARQAWLPEDDVALLGGVPVTTAVRTACDLARHLTPFMALSALDAFAQSGMDRAEAASRIADAGFPLPVCQIWIVDDDGVGVYRLDMGWEEARAAVEYDGLEFHSRPEDVAHDVTRRRRLADEFGWTCVGVDRGDVLGRSLELERGIGELLGLEPQITRRLW